MLHAQRLQTSERHPGNELVVSSLRGCRPERSPGVPLSAKSCLFFLSPRPQPLDEGT